MRSETSARHIQNKLTKKKEGFYGNHVRRTFRMQIRTSRLAKKKKNKSPVKRVTRRSNELAQQGKPEEQEQKKVKEIIHTLTKKYQKPKEKKARKAKTKKSEETQQTTPSSQPDHFLFEDSDEDSLKLVLSPAKSFEKTQKSLRHNFSKSTDKENRDSKSLSRSKNHSNAGSRAKRKSLPSTGKASRSVLRVKKPIKRRLITPKTKTPNNSCLFSTSQAKVRKTNDATPPRSISTPELGIENTSGYEVVAVDMDISFRFNSPGFMLSPVQKATPIVKAEGLSRPSTDLPEQFASPKLNSSITTYSREHTPDVVRVKRFLSTETNESSKDKKKRKKKEAQMLSSKWQEVADKMNQEFDDLDSYELSIE